MKQKRILLSIAIAQMINAQTYIELGIQSGRTINEMSKYVNNCIGVDINDCSIHLTDNITFYNMSTDKFISIWDKSKKVDMVFIDADHSHESSYRDFINYKDIVRNDGIILLHDIYPCNEEYTKPNRCHDTWKTAIKIKQDHFHECEIVTIPDGCGLSIVRMNRGKHLQWVK
jgi:hypothetical protein